MPKILSLPATVVIQSRSVVDSAVAPTWASALSPMTISELPNSVDFVTAGSGLVGSTWSSPALTATFLKGMIDAYSDGVYDPISKKIYFAGGGHNDSPCNGVFALDPWTLKWSMPVAPTPQSAYPPAYVAAGWNQAITYPNTPNNETFQTAATLAPADLQYAAPFAARRSTHTYGSLGVWQGKILFHYNLFGRAWVTPGNYWDKLELKDPYGPQLVAKGWGYINQPLQPGTMCLSDYIDGTQYVTNVPGDAGDNGRSGLLVINPDTQQIVDNIPSVTGYCAQLGQNDDTVFMIGYTRYLSGDGYNVFMRIPKKTRKTEWYQVTGDICPFNKAQNAETVPGFFDGTYMWLWPYGDDPNYIYRISATPTPGETAFNAAGAVKSTKLPITIVGSLPPMSYKYRLHYVPEAKAALFLPNGSSKCWVVKTA